MQDTPASPQSTLKEFAIAFAASEAYVPGATALITSIGRNARLDDGTRVVAICEKLTPESEHILQSAAHLAGLDLKLLRAEGTKVSGARPMGSTLQARLQAPILLADYERVLLIDADALVTNSIRPLVELDLAGTPFAAVTEFFDRLAPYGPRRRWSAESHVASGRLTFNVGVLLIDTRAWVNLDLTRRAAEYLDAWPELCPWFDQSALNAVAEHWVQLDAVWNLYPLAEHVLVPPLDALYTTHRPLFDHVFSLVPKARVLHYHGTTKPWHDDFPDGPNKRLFLDYLPPEPHRHSSIASVRH